MARLVVSDGMDVRALVSCLAVLCCMVAFAEVAQAQRLAAPFERYTAESPLRTSPLTAEIGGALPGARKGVADAGQPGTSVAVMLGGMLGSGLGVWGGIEAGEWARDYLRFTCCGDDPGQLAQIIGVLTLSVTGTMLGTSVADAAASRPPVPPLRRLRDALTGLGLGVVALVVTSRVTDGSTAPLVAYSIAQGTYAGLSNGRW
jgi:hypothetical protein